MESEMERFIILVFMSAAATIVDAEPLICDGCRDELNAEQWAVEKFAQGREVGNIVFQPTEQAAKEYIARFGYEYVAE
jgi:hypothetical protein